MKTKTMDYNNSNDGYQVSASTGIFFLIGATSGYFKFLDAYYSGPFIFLDSFITALFKAGFTAFACGMLGVVGKIAGKYLYDKTKMYLQKKFNNKNKSS